MRSPLHRRHSNRRWRRAVTCLALGTIAVLAAPAAAHAQGTPQRRPGKVLIIRGAFTVFSLGLDTLGDQLKEQGLDVTVIPAFMATSATEELVEAYRQRPQPIVIIGHSKGGLLAPQCAEQLAKSRIPVPLVVVVDNPHRATVPANVERCVNFYQTNFLGVVQGALMKAESSKTELLNVNIDQLPQRDEGGYIDHFNIDASPWVHAMIVKQVLRACPTEAAAAEARNSFGGAYRLATPSRPAAPTRRAMRAWPPEAPSPTRAAKIPRHNPLSWRDVKVMR